MSRTARETPEQVKAYALYASMGEKRTVVEVAKQLGRSQSTVIAWSKRWKWTDRVKKDEESIKSVVLQRVSERIVKDAEAFKLESMSLVDDALDAARHTLERGEMDLSRPGDVVNLIKAGLLLRGEATERKETVQVKAKENALKILEMVRVGGDPLALGVGGAVPVFELEDEGGSEA